MTSANEKPELTPGLAAFLVAQELLTSERTYVAVLHLIDQVRQSNLVFQNAAIPMSAYTLRIYVIAGLALMDSGLMVSFECERIPKGTCCRREY